MPDHPLKKNEILDIYYNGLTNASRDFLDSCASCVFREQTIGQAKELLNNILKNSDDWLFLNHLLNPLQRRGVSYISVLKICKRQRNLWKKKGIKAEDVKNLPPIEEIHGLNTPPLPKVVEVNS